MLKMILWLQILIMSYIGIAAGESAWTTLPKVQFNGLTKTSLTRLDACLKACLLIGWCNVVSYDSEAPLPCEIQTFSVGIEESKETKDSITSYIVDKYKLASGKICWKEVRDKTAKSLMAGLSSDLYECLMYCIVVEVCEAMAYDIESNPACWYHGGLSGSFKEEDLIPMNGSIVYMLDKSCALAEGLNVSKNEPKLENITPTSGESAWTTLPTVQFKGLTKTSVIRLDACLKICLYSGWCKVVSYDIEDILPCKIQTYSVGVEQSNETKDSVTSYVVDRYKLGTGKTCWKEVHNKTAKALVTTALRDLYKCFFYCIIIDVCEVLAYDPKSNSPCWLHEGLSGSIKEQDLITLEGSVVYLLDKSCTFPVGFNESHDDNKLENGAP